MKRAITVLAVLWLSAVAVSEEPELPRTFQGVALEAPIAEVAQDPAFRPPANMAGWARAIGEEVLIRYDPGDDQRRYPVDVSGYGGRVFRIQRLYEPAGDSLADFAIARVPGLADLAAWRADRPYVAAWMDGTTRIACYRTDHGRRVVIAFQDVARTLAMRTAWHDYAEAHGRGPVQINPWE